MRLLITLALLAAGSLSQAASLRINANEVVGVDGIVIGGISYTGDFIDGSCIDVYTGCDDIGDFPFDATEALAAMTQIRSAFQSSPFVNSPNSVTGCLTGPPNNGCQIVLPHTPTGTNGITVVRFIVSTASVPAVTSNLGLNRMTDATFRTHVRFTPSPVPLPAAAWLFLTGIGGLAGLRKLRLKAQAN